MKFLCDCIFSKHDARSAQARAQQEAAEEKKSRLEVMKEMRDYKRRRQKYRAKNVHITQKSIKNVSCSPSPYMYFLLNYMRLHLRFINILK